MATFSSWADVRTDIKNAIATHAAGDPCIGSYSVEGVSVNYKSIDELTKLYHMTYKLEALDTAGTPGSRVSYGSPRRFR